MGIYKEKAVSDIMRMFHRESWDCELSRIGDETIKRRLITKLEWNIYIYKVKLYKVREVELAT